jgi:hypothetical protein
MIDEIMSEILHNETSKESHVIGKIDMYFLFACMWSLGASIDEHSQQEFCLLMKEQAQELQKIDGGKDKGGKDFKIDKKYIMPDGGQPATNYFIDEESGNWHSWKDFLHRTD